jgi:DNA-binding winged helix-turn-helix (wHTH) protein
MRKNIQNVQKLDVLVAKLREYFPDVPLRIKQTAKTLKFKGFGIRAEWHQTETTAQLETEADDGGR